MTRPVEFARGAAQVHSPTQIDPSRFEVIRNALVEATEEMASALRRSAYSTNIKTRHDFSCAVFDLDARTVAQSFSQPNHLGSLVETVPRALARYGRERLGEGDGILVNLPYEGGVHLNDITLISRPRSREISGSGGDLDAALKTSRAVYFAESGGHVDCPVYDRYSRASRCVGRRSWKRSTPLR